MVGGDKVQEVQEGNAQDETQEQMLTEEEEIKEIKEKVDEEEEGDLLAALLKKTIDTILVEEFFETNMKMNKEESVGKRSLGVCRETRRRQS